MRVEGEGEDAGKGERVRGLGVRVRARLGLGVRGLSQSCCHQRALAHVIGVITS